jgi:hypothetical protein
MSTGLATGSVNVDRADTQPHTRQVCNANAHMIPTHQTGMKDTHTRQVCNANAHRIPAHQTGMQCVHQTGMQRQRPQDSRTPDRYACL